MHYKVDIKPLLYPLCYFHLRTPLPWFSCTSALIEVFARTFLLSAGCLIINWLEELWRRAWHARHEHSQWLMFHFTPARHVFGQRFPPAAPLAIPVLCQQGAHRHSASDKPSGITPSGALFLLLLPGSHCVQPCGITARHITAALSLHLILWGEFL